MKYKVRGQLWVHLLTSMYLASTFCFLLHNILPKPNLRFIFKDNIEIGRKNKRYLGKYSLDINGQVSMGTSIPPYNTKSQSIRAFLQSNNLRLRCSENTTDITQNSNVCLWGLYAEGTLTEIFYQEVFQTVTNHDSCPCTETSFCTAQNSNAVPCTSAPRFENTPF